MRLHMPNALAPVLTAIALRRRFPLVRPHPPRPAARTFQQEMAAAGNQPR